MLVVVGVILGSLWWFHDYSLRQELAAIYSDQRDLLNDRHHQVNLGLSRLVNDLQEQAFTFEVEQWGEESTQPDLEEMVEHFSHFLRRHPLYTQMRWIGKNGHERVRVDRKGSEVVTVAKEQLQDKSDRYYTQKTLSLSPGQTYVSRMDLNIEQGKIELPHQPTLRISYRLGSSRSGSDNGFLILNVAIDQLLNKVIPVQKTGLWLMNKQGKLLFEKSQQHELQFLLRRPEGVAVQLFEIVSDITATHTWQQRTTDGGLLGSIEISADEYGANTIAQERWYLLNHLSLEQLPLQINNLEMLLLISPMALTAVVYLQVLRGRRSQYSFSQSLEETVERRTQELKAVNYKLEQKSRYIENVMGIVGDGIWDWDIKNNLVTPNRRWIEVLGLDERYLEHTVEMFAELIHEEDRSRVMACVNRYLKGECDEYRSEHRMQLHSNEYIWVTDRGRAIEWGEDGQPIRMVGGMIDITERKQLEQELLSASQAKDDFLASMSHELRTPLTAIIGCGEFLDQTELTAEQQNLTDTIQTSGNNLLSLVNDILDLSKIQAGKFDIDYAPYDLSALHQHIHSTFAARAANAGLQFEIRQQLTPTYELWGDDNRISQILLNLISNAIKFTQQGGITLTNWREENRLLFSVEDSGIGMSQEVLERLFQPFEQASSGTSRRFGGTGLGLHISRSLAEMMGGEISVESEEGKGSCFTLNLPYEESDLFAQTQSNPAEQKSTHTGERFVGRVLVAEDAPELQMLERKLLESMGATVTLANNGAEALTKASESEFDLILMDMQMPEMDGLEATDLLRKMGNSTPIVALTANVMQKHKEQFQAAGCSDFLSKPIDKRALQQVVAQYLKPDRKKAEGTQKSKKGASEASIATQESRVVSGGRILALDDDNGILHLYETVFGGNSASAARLDELLTLTEHKINGASDKEEESSHFSLSLAPQGVVGIEMVRAALARGEPYSIAFIDMRMPPGIDGLETAQEIRKLDPDIYIVFVTAYSDVTIQEINEKLQYGVLYLEKPFSRTEIQQIAHMLDRQWVANHSRVLPVETEEVPQQEQSEPEESSTISPIINDSLMELFYQRVKELGEEFETALKSEAWSDARKAAHTLKGTGGSFGQPGLTRLAGEFCTACDTQQQEQLPTLGQRLVQEIETILA